MLFDSVLSRIEEKRELGLFFKKSQKVRGIVQHIAIIVSSYLKEIDKELSADQFDNLILRMSRDIGIK